MYKYVTHRRFIQEKLKTFEYTLDVGGFIGFPVVILTPL